MINNERKLNILLYSSERDALGELKETINEWIFWIKTDILRLFTSFSCVFKCFKWIMQIIP